MIIYVCEQLLIPNEGDNDQTEYWEPVQAVYTKQEAEFFMKSEEAEECCRNYYPLELK